MNVIVVCDSATQAIHARGLFPDARCVNGADPTSLVGHTPLEWLVTARAARRPEIMNEVRRRSLFGNRGAVYVLEHDGRRTPVVSP